MNLVPDDTFEVYVTGKLDVDEASACGDKIDAGQPASKESMMTKYVATETACKCCDEATRIMGAYAYAMEYPVQRYFRDARFLLYGGGTHEVLQQNIARELKF